MRRLTRAGAVDHLFRRFDAAIRAAGYIAMSDQLVDSTLMAALKQRNTRPYGAVGGAICKPMLAPTRDPDAFTESFARCA